MEKNTYRGALLSTFLSKYSGDQIKNEIDGVCSAYGGEERCIRSFDMEA